MNNITLGEKIRSLRKSLKMTQNDLSSKVSVSKAAISQFENGENRPSASTLAKLSQTLGVDLSLYVAEPTVPAFHKGANDYVGYIGSHPILGVQNNVSIPIIYETDSYNRVKHDYLGHEKAVAFPQSPHRPEPEPFKSLSLPPSLLPEGQHIVFPVYGSSMEPTFTHEDLLVFTAVAPADWFALNGTDDESLMPVCAIYSHDVKPHMSISIHDGTIENRDMAVPSFRICRPIFKRDNPQVICKYDNVRDYRPALTDKVIVEEIKEVWLFSWRITTNSENPAKELLDRIDSLQNELTRTHQVIDNLLRQNPPSLKDSSDTVQAP